MSQKKLPDKTAKRSPMKFRQRADEDYSLQLTPLIDVVFLLLIFFMVSTVFVDFTRQMDIELPESKSGTALTETKLFTLEVNKNGVIYLDGEEVLKEEISGIVSANKTNHRSVIIRADKSLHYGLAVEIMGICKSAGITDIGLAVL